MVPDAASFRKVMGRFATGVTVVTTIEAGRPWGITVNAFSSLSLEPPLVMVALDRRRFFTPIVERTRAYAVNVLAEDQQALSDCFAGAPVSPGREAFCGAAWRPGAGGAPVLEGAIAIVECRVSEVVGVGDHDLLVGLVDTIEELADEAGPLLYYRRRYLRIERASEMPVEGKPEHPAH